MKVIVEYSWNVFWSGLVEVLRLEREFALRMRCHLYRADGILVVPRLLRPIVHGRFFYGKEMMNMECDRRCSFRTIFSYTLQGGTYHEKTIQ